MKNFKSFTQKICLSLILIYSISFSATAQKVTIGARFMPTFSALNLKTSTGGSVAGSTTLGYGYGGFIGFNFNKMIGVQAEVLYSSYNQKYKEVDREHNINLKYLNIPLLLSLNTGIAKTVNMNVVAGPQIGISMGTNMTVSGGTNNNQAVLAVKKGDLGLAYGVGFDFGLNKTKTIRMGFGYRGVLGLIDISDNSNNANSGTYYILDKTKLKTNAAYIGLSLLL